MKTSDFDYELPKERIAQTPFEPRDECRMLVIDRAKDTLEDRIFKDIVDYLQPGDLLVANETRVLPARLLGEKRGTGGASEVLLLKEAQTDEPRTNRVAFWEALVRPGKRLKPGTGALVDFKDPQGNIAMTAEIIDWVPNAQKGERLVRIKTELDSLDEALDAVGHVPLPPYIKDYAGDEEMYQTVYSKREGSAAAPTAGLHFTPELIDKLKNMGVGWETVELEVGLDTFRVVDEENAEDHAMHTERYTVPEKTVQAINECKAKGGRVIAVGTTSVRSLESAWVVDNDSEDTNNNKNRYDIDSADGKIVAKDRASTSLFLLPGSKFHVVDAIITNFHVPRSTLMMLVSAFAGRDKIMQAYKHAIESEYRMLSFGDAMLIL